MFDSRHYVPILRWKAAEREGLEKLSSDEKKFITPLLEILMPQSKRSKDGEKPKTPEELLRESIAKLKTTLPNIPGDILKYWGMAPAFIDVDLLDISVRKEGLTQILTLGNKLGLFLISVIGLNSDIDIQKTAVSFAKKNNYGLCLRLFPSDFNKNTLATSIKNFVINNSISEQNIDILVDLQITNSQSLKFTEIIKQIPDIIKWRTFTVASGAFPKDLTGFTVNLHMIDRLDWNSWLLQYNSNDLLRKPSFSDYTIQHPIYKEPIPGSNPSASIRYTLPEKWMIMRGQALRGEKSQGHAQYPANAQLVMQQREFFGADFSYGDSYIAEKGKDVTIKETGTPRTWLRAGINHHLACVASQLSNLL